MPEFGLPTRLELGDSFDISNPSEIKSSKVIVSRSTIKPVGNPQTNFWIHEVTDRSVFMDRLNISASMQARCLFFKVQGSLNIDTDYIFDNDNIVYMIKAYNDYGQVSLSKDYHLQPNAQHLIDTKQYATFKEQYGTHFVEAVNKDAYVAVILSLTNTNKGTKSSLRTSFSANYGSMVSGGGQLNVGFDKFMEAAAKTENVSFDFRAMGGPPLEKLKGAVTAATATDFKNVIADYIGKMTLETAQPTRFIAQSMGQFGLRMQIPANTPEAFLAALYISYEDAKQTITRLGQVLDPQGTYSYILPAQKTEYGNDLKSYQRYLNVLKDAAQHSNGRHPILSMPPPPPPVNWPFVKIDVSPAFVDDRNHSGMPHSFIDLNVSNGDFTTCTARLLRGGNYFNEGPLSPVPNGVYYVRFGNPDEHGSPSLPGDIRGQIDQFSVQILNSQRRILASRTLD